MDWTGVYFRYDAAAEETLAYFSNGVDQYALRAGNGHFAESLLFARKFKPKLVDLMATPDTERCRTAASCAAEEGKLTFAVRFLNCPQKMECTFAADGDVLRIHFEAWGALEADAADLLGHRC
jgi:hypothetical protein